MGDPPPLQEAPTHAVTPRLCHLPLSGTERKEDPGWCCWIRLRTVLGSDISSWSLLTINLAIYILLSSTCDIPGTVAVARVSRVDKRDGVSWSLPSFLFLLISAALVRGCGLQNWGEGKASSQDLEASFEAARCPRDSPLLCQPEKA